MNPRAAAARVVDNHSFLSPFFFSSSIIQFEEQAHNPHHQWPNLRLKSETDKTNIY